MADLHREIVNRYLSPDNIQRFVHGGEWCDSDGEAESHAIWQSHSYESRIKPEDIACIDLRLIDRFVRNFSASMEQQFLQMMYKLASDSAESSGTYVHATGDVTITDAFLDMLERMDFSIDSEGNLELPDVHLGSAAFERFKSAFDSASPELESKVKEVLRRKESEARERERLRREKFMNYG